MNGVVGRTGRTTPKPPIATKIRPKLKKKGLVRIFIKGSLMLFYAVKLAMKVDKVKQACSKATKSPGVSV